MRTILTPTSFDIASGTLSAKEEIQSLWARIAWPPPYSLIDDSPGECELFRQALTQAGYQGRLDIVEGAARPWPICMIICRTTSRR